MTKLYLCLREAYICGNWPVSLVKASHQIDSFLFCFFYKLIVSTLRLVISGHEEATLFEWPLGAIIFGLLFSDEETGT